MLYKYDWRSGDVEIVGCVALKIEPLRLWALFREFDLSPSWMPRSSDSTMVASFGKESELYRFQSRPILPFLPAVEMYQERNYVDALDEHGTLMMIGLSPAINAEEHKGVAIPPPCSGFKRLTTVSRNMVQPWQGGSLLTLHRSIRTQFRCLPNQLIGRIASTITTESAAALQRVCANWKGGLHAHRVLNGQRSAYYAQLKQRLAEVSSRCPPDAAAADKGLEAGWLC